MAYVYTWDTTGPVGTDPVADGATEIREGVKAALNERLLTFINDLSADPLRMKDLIPFETGTQDLGTTAVRWDRLYVDGIAVNSAVTPADGDIVLPVAGKLRLDGTIAGDTYIWASVDNDMKLVSEGNIVLGYTSASNIVAVGGTGMTVRIGAETGSIGFFDGAGVAQPEITGSRGGNAALQDLLDSLDSLGLILNSSTA
jgi:hypothetical protein